MSKPALIITRPSEKGEDFAKLVEARYPAAFDMVFAPLLEITQEPCALDLDGVQGLLFTSAQGVVAFAERVADRSVPALCVGPGTTKVAQAIGLSAQSADGDAAALASLAAGSYLPGAGRYVHFRGGQTAGDLAMALMNEGVECEDRIIYEQRYLALGESALDVITSGQEVWFPVFSPRTAQALATELANIPITNLMRFLTISRNAADRLAHLSEDITIAEQPNIEGMLKLLART